MKMWIRQIEVLSGNKKFVNYGENALEIDFDIPFSDKKEPDVAEINIYNLSRSSVNEIRDEGYVYVNAGYKNLGNVGNIFTGQIEEVIPSWQGVDKLTKIIVSDGAKKWRGVDVNKTYQAGSSASYIMRDLANLLSYQIVEINPVDDKVFKRGYTVKGKASNQLKRLVDITNSKMFVNKNRIVIRDKKVGYNTGFILNSDSGLIGSPQREVEEKEDKKTKKKKRIVRWRVASLLNPLIETDSIIRVESRELNGEFRVVEGRHTRDFNTEMLVEEV